MRTLALLLLAGCAARPALLPHEALAGRAVAKAWAEKGLPAPTRQKRCDVESFDVVVTTTAADWHQWCPLADPGKTFGCLAWEYTAHWFFWRERPIVVISPMHHTEPTIVVHELMHAYTQCAALRKDPWDPADARHTDPRVWSAPGGVEAAQSRADTLSKQGP